MSLRNIRKIYGGNTLPPPENSSDEEYEPLYAKAASKFDGLVLSSHSENEDVDIVEEEEEQEQTETKKKKKKKRKNNKARNNNLETATTYEKENIEELDEIDRSVLEVNAILGKPETPPPLEEDPTEDPAKGVMKVQPKYLNLANEKFYAPTPTKAEKKSKRVIQRQPNNIYPLHIRKNTIVPLDKYFVRPSKHEGLSMSILRREDGNTYFVYDHNKLYQKNHAWLLNISTGNRRFFDAALLEKAESTRHVEALLECADEMFRMEMYSAGNTLIEWTLLYLLYSAHPTFNLANMKTRLEYKYLENRPFHIVVLKYLHLLTNRACHRGALELAKVLLNLDPSDPLAVVFIIDTVALRAREHEWLIEAIDHWKKERGAGFLFNIQYSYAMSKFHVAKNNEDDTDIAEADELLQTAIRRFPFLAKKLLESLYLGQKTHLRDHELFQTIAVKWTTKDYFQDVISLHVKLVCSKWREPMVAEWFIRNTEELLSKYDNDPKFKEETLTMTIEQFSLYRGLPQEMIRHLCVIKPLENLLIDSEIPKVPRFRSFDPLPPKNGVNRYGYELNYRANHSSSYFLSLFFSMLPAYQLPEEPEGPQQEGAQPQQPLEMFQARWAERAQRVAAAEPDVDAAAAAREHAQMVDDLLRAAGGGAEQNMHRSDTESDEN